MRRKLDNDQARLYELIWIRTIASQMGSAELERTTRDIAAKAGPAWNCAPGQVVKFDGFSRSIRKAATTAATTRIRAACPR
jgi:DNA topoisomerase-1